MTVEIIISKLKAWTKVTIEPQNRDGYFARKETVRNINYYKKFNKYLDYHVLDITFHADYGFIIRTIENE